MVVGRGGRSFVRRSSVLFPNPEVMHEEREGQYLTKGPKMCLHMSIHKSSSCFLSHKYITLDTSVNFYTFLLPF